MKLYKKGFTLVEILVATGVLVILVGVGAANFSSSRRSARDSRRKSDVQAILGAMNQYVSVNGTAFVQNIDTTTKSKLACGVPQATDDPPAAVNPSVGCVGALGRSYGKINLKGTSLSSPLTDGYGGSATAILPARPYATTSIGEALLNGGYIASVPRDPASTGVALTDSKLRDYVLIRACRNGGKQSISTNGTLFAVWAALELPPSPAEADIANRLPGGYGVIPNAADGTVYQYDFAANRMEFDSGLYTSYGFAAGNGGAATYSSASDCEGKPKEEQIS